MIPDEYDVVVHRLWNALRGRCPLVQWKVYDHMAVFCGAPEDMSDDEFTRFTLFYIRAWLRVEARTFSSQIAVSREILWDDFDVVVEGVVKNFLRAVMGEIMDWRPS